MNLRSFSLYSYPLPLSNLGKPNWSWILRDHIHIQKRNCLLIISIDHKIRHFHVVVMQKWQRHVQKSVAKLLFCLLNLCSCCFWVTGSGVPNACFIQNNRKWYHLMFPPQNHATFMLDGKAKANSHSQWFLSRCSVASGLKKLPLTG